MDLLAKATALIASAHAHNVTIATAESCTGGLIFGALTDVAGSSAVMDRGFVTYSNAAKHQMLGVSQDSLSRFGAVSEQVAREMAEGALQRSDASRAIAVTGVAGPGGTAAKPEGMVCFALARAGADTICDTRQFGPLGRQQVRHATVAHALSLLADSLHSVA